jgi:putative DNA primase/helicase
MTSLLDTARQYRTWGASVNAIKQGTKETLNKWADLYKTPQTLDQMESYPWNRAGGIGILNGLGGWHTFDIDAPKDKETHQPLCIVTEDAIDELLDQLQLPRDCPWVWRGASKAGWALAFSCDEPLPAGVLPAAKREAGVAWGYPAKDSGADWDHLELRYTGCQTVYPPSAGYNWRYDAPTEPPPRVPIHRVIAAFFALCPPAPHTLGSIDRAVIDQIRERFDLVEYAVQTFGGDVQVEGHEIRVTGHGGMLINPEQHIWNCFSDDIGGDCFDLVAYGDYRTTARNLNGKSAQVLAKAAEYAGVTIPQRTPTTATPNPRPRAANTDEPQAAPYSDIANARQFVTEHGADLRYVAEWGWLVWDGCRWALDATAEHQRRAKATAINLSQPVSDETDQERNDRLKYARAGSSAGKIAAMISLAESELAVRAKPDDFDNQPMILTCANGALDLTTGKLLPHDRADLATKAADIIYDPNAKAHLWLTFLDRIFAGNQDLIGYVQRAIGYTLTGSTSAQCMFILHGTGANGKSVLIDVIRAILGDYARNADSSTFMTQQSDRIRSDVARLAGARFVATVEIDEGRRLSEALVKQVSSGDRMTARFLNKNDFEFTPRFKLWMATNHKPVIKGTDYAIWRRIKLIPFTVTIPEAERDGNLTDKLLGELPGILAWAVRGCLEYQAKGLQEPDAIRAATNAYRADMDELGNFMDECTVSGERYEASAAALYGAYIKWSAGSKQAVTQNRFGKQMNERGFERIRRRNGFYYIGIGLADMETEPTADDGPLFGVCDPCDPCEPLNGGLTESKHNPPATGNKDHKDHKDHTIADSAVRAIPYKPRVGTQTARQQEEAELEAIRLADEELF